MSQTSLRIDRLLCRIEPDAHPWDAIQEFVRLLPMSHIGNLDFLLELPGIALGWIRALLKLSLKYKNVFGSGDLGQELVALSRTVKTIIALMADPERCELIAVAL